MSNRIQSSYLLIEASAATWTGLPHLSDAWLQALGRQQMPGSAIAIPNIGILSYCETLEQAMTLTSLTTNVAVPSLSASTRVSLDAGDLLYLRDVISHDLDWMKAQGAEVVRPTLFVMAASDPGTLDWTSGVSELLSPEFRYRPNTIGFALNAAAAGFVRAIAPAPSMIADPALDAGTALASAIDTCFDVIRKAAVSGSLSLPPSVHGFQPLT